MEQTLKEQVNKVEIVGTLKSHEIAKRTTKDGSTVYISGKAKVEVEQNGQTNLITVSVYAKEGNKVYQGLETVINEYKTTEEVVAATGDEHAKGDRIKVRGSIDVEEYISNRTEQFISFNIVKGVFFNRITEKDKEFNKPDYTKVLVDANIQAIKPKMDKQGLPTGELIVDAFVVGYNQKIIPLYDFVVGTDLAASFQTIYRPQTTAKLSLIIENYAVAKEKPVVTTAAALGSTFDDIGERVVYDYVNDLRLFGGDAPYTDFRNLTPEQHEMAIKLRQQKIDSFNNPEPQTTGFTKGLPTAPATQEAALKAAVQNVEEQLPFNNAVPNNSVPSF